MDTTFETLTTETLTRLIAWVEGVGEFVAGQAPAYCQEVIWRAHAIGGIGCVLALAVMVLPSMLWRRTRKLERLSVEADVGLILAAISGVAAIIITSLIFGVLILPAIEATIAPRVYLLEHLRGLI